MAQIVRATRDPALSARVVTRTALRYALGADAGEDRPAHVRAGSGIAWLAGRLAIVQDDAAFVALVDPSTKVVEPVPLPRGPSGARQFDDLRGNKAEKLDLEACVTIDLDGADALLAFGSGSTPRRERVAVVRAPASGGIADVRVLHVPSLYAMLRARRDFSGSELNVEGVVASSGLLWLVQRGNGEARDGLEPKNALGALPLASVIALLSGASPLLELERVTEYDLGAIGGVPLTFTDATSGPAGALLYLAAAEASPDAVRDGPVMGSGIGVISATRARQAALSDTDGRPLLEKTEGVVLDPGDPTRAFVVIDPDDPARPCELCDVVLDGPWW